MAFDNHCCPPRGWAATQLLRAMKLTAIILLTACLQVSAKGYSQVISLAETNAPLTRVFQKIEKQSGYFFWYTVNTLNGAKPVNINVQGIPLEQVLSLLFKDQPYSYNIVEKIIVIKVKEPARPQPTAVALTNPPIDVKGKVYNENGEPLAGITVTIKESKKVTTTDANGEFSISNTNSDATLIFSGVSVEAFEVNVAGKAELTIRLTTKVNKLDDVQVIAYGTTTQRFNTGNVTTVKSEDIARQPVTNPLAALEGRVPGMVITQQKGLPGGAFTVQIRGQNSIQSGNEPLYIIDGVPFSPSVTPTIGNIIIGLGSALNYINPADIESIDILKDADATAIYGSRGANGVMLITTKKGKAGATKTDINVYNGVGKVTRKLPLLNLGQYLQAVKEGFKNDGITTIPSTAYDVNGTWDSTKYTDWQDEFIGGTARFFDAQASVSGGNSNTQFLIGGGYHRETTVFPGTSANNKGTVHFNVTNSSTNKRFKVSLQGTYQVDKNQLPRTDFSANGYVFTAPDAPPLRNADGTLNWANSTWTNPLSTIEERYKSNITNLIANSLVSYQIINGLEIKTSLGYTAAQINEVIATPTTFYNPAQNVVNGKSTFSNKSVKSWIIEPQLTYRRQIGQGQLNALVGTTIQNNATDGQVVMATGYTNDALLENIQGAAAITKGASVNTNYKYNALFGRLNYNLMDKYLINVVARRDGSSRFGPGKQFGNFGAVGAAWIFSQEKFFAHNLKFLSFGKLRASYGTSGNDQIGDYQYLSLYNFTTNLPYQGSVGSYPNNLFNSDFAWEVNKKLEFGIETGFFDNRLLVNANYYTNRSSNQLINYQLPTTTGFSSVLANLPAVVENKGWEFSISSTNIKNLHFSWTSSFNLSISRNKLVSFPNIDKTTYINTLQIGQPLTVLKLYHLKGVNDTTGIYQFTDSKGNATYSPSATTDKTVLLDLAPKFYGGLQNHFQYKQIGLDFLLQFVKQMGNNVLFSSSYPPGFFRVNNIPDYIFNERWQKSGDKAAIQKLTSQSSGATYNAFNFAKTSDYAYSDASFIRLKNISLSYQLPQSLVDRMHLQLFRVYVQAQNMFTITKYKGFDPENRTNNVTPPLRVIVAGIQITL